MYSLMGMMSSSTVRQMFGAGSEMVPLEFIVLSQGSMSGLLEQVTKISIHVYSKYAPV